MSEEIGFYTKRQIRELSGISLTQIDRLEKAGKFPKRCIISGNSRNSKIGWLRSEFHLWIAERAALRDMALRRE